MQKSFFLFLYFGISLALSSQITLREDSVIKVQLSSYLECYVSGGSNDGPKGKNGRPFFLYNHTSTQSLAVNLAMFKTAMETNRSRANIAFMTGTYAEKNLATEANWAKNLYEANVGIKISSTKNTWLDVGILPSHIGFESAISRDCQNLTRSLMAENSPYYECGLRLSHTSLNEKWYLAFLYLNGWQRVLPDPYPTVPNVGTQVTWKPNANLSLNHSSFFGKIVLGNELYNRLYHNIYASWNIGLKHNVLACIDMGSQWKENTIASKVNWYTWTVLWQWKWHAKWSTCFRAEQFTDPAQTIIYTGDFRKIQINGYSVNLDFKPAPKTMFRIEPRYLYNKDAIFGAKANHHSDFSLTTAAIFWF